MTASFAALGADEIDAGREGLLGVPGSADHVHDQDAGPVQARDDVGWWNAQRGDEQFRPFGYHHVDQCVELAPCVVRVGLACAVAQFGQGEIHPERERGGFQPGFELVDHLEECRGGVAEPADDAEAAGVGDCGGEGTVGCVCHAGEEDGVFDREEGAEGCLKMRNRVGRGHGEERV